VLEFIDSEHSCSPKIVDTKMSVLGNNDVT
jgi:hypothetical protein